MSDDLPLNPSDHPFRRQTQPGAAPGTFIPPPDASPTRIKVLCYSPTEIHEEELADVGKLCELLTRWPVTWVNVEGLADVRQLHADLKVFTDLLKLQFITVLSLQVPAEGAGDAD